jgi:hypothetical protein
MVPYIATKLTARGRHQFLECVTTVGVWVLGHGLHGLRCVIGRDASPRNPADQQRKVRGVESIRILSFKRPEAKSPLRY